ncbi:MAG TPA: serine hydrolase domain-containing protein, partial [Hymenobacter sp.]|nr:serine hydrolase domain-containing protein [Hymenobacter sp.]
YNPNSPLAHDRRGGSRALLQLIDALRKQPPLQNDLTVLFTAFTYSSPQDTESFQDKLPLAQEHDVLLEIKHLDEGGEVLLFFASKYNYPLVEKYAQAVRLRSTRQHQSPTEGDNMLDFVHFLGNSPLQDHPKLRSPAVSVVINPQTGISYPGLEPLDEAVRAFMRKWSIPGGAVALTKEGRLVYARGFGFAHRQAHTPVRPTHLFRIASLSKPITSVAVLRLMEQGLLRLDSPVFGPGGILSDSSYGTITDKRVKQITIRHLLEHSAGWDREVSRDVMFDPVTIARIMQVYPPADSKSIIRYALSQPLDFPPGTRYAYSNVGYCVLGRVIEKLTGLAYEEYVTTSILHPLGIEMMRIGASVPTTAETEEVRYYAASNQPLVPSIFSNRIRVPWAYGGFYLEAMDAHGGWIASAPDLLRFLVAVDGLATKPDILSPATVALMSTPTAALQSGYGLGWWVNSEGSWTHTGALPGTSTLLERTRDGYTWAVLFNRRPTDPAYFNELSALIRNQLPAVPRWPTYDLFQLPSAALVDPITAADTMFHTPLLHDSTAIR